jgi:hypothetical protein
LSGSSFRFGLANLLASFGASAPVPSLRADSLQRILRVAEKASLQQISAEFRDSSSCGPDYPLVNPTAIFHDWT